VTVELDPSAVGSLRFGLTSDTSGESTEADVLDPASQSSARIGVLAFEGCVGSTGCEESFSLSFSRTDGDEGDLSFTWSLDGFASTDAESPGDGDGTLDFSVAE
jgi:hypothetical protein